MTKKKRAPSARTRLKLGQGTASMSVNVTVQGEPVSVSVPLPADSGVWRRMRPASTAMFQLAGSNSNNTDKPKRKFGPSSTPPSATESVQDESAAQDESVASDDGI